MSSPKNPLLAQLLAQSPSRRRLLASAGAAAAVAATAAAASGCAPPPPPAGGRGQARSCRRTVSATEKVVNWANWTAYIDFDDKTKKYPTLEAFKKKTGIKVDYTEDIDDNDAYFAKIAPQLAAGQDIGRDIFVLHRLDGRPADPRRATCQKLDLVQHPERRSNLLRHAQGRRVRPGPAATR